MRISDWSSDVCSSDLPVGLFTQLANLSDRYLEADGLRRSLFSQDLKGCFLIVAGAVTLFRMPRFLKRLAADLENHPARRSEEHTSELQSLMRTSYAVFCLK